MLNLSITQLNQKLKTKENIFISGPNGIGKFFLANLIHNQISNNNFITNENGTFSFTYLYEGNYEILMVRAGYEDSIFTFSLVDFENSNLNFTLCAEIKFGFIL